MGVLYAPIAAKLIPSIAGSSRFDLNQKGAHSGAVRADLS
jgi:hypothetical protein